MVITHSPVQHYMHNTCVPFFVSFLVKSNGLISQIALALSMRHSLRYQLFPQPPKMLLSRQPRLLERPALAAAEVLLSASELFNVRILS